LRANDKTVKFLHQSDEGVKKKMDNLSQTYTELLDGVYDCPDRIVLNAYFRRGYIPGGFRLWWRDLHGSDVNWITNI
jgi:hypothetical protein